MELCYKILKEEKSINLAEDVLEEISGQLAAPFFTSKATEGGWDSHGFSQALMTHFPITVDENAFDDDYLSIEEIERESPDKIIIKVWFVIRTRNEIQFMGIGSKISLPNHVIVLEI